MKTCSSWQLAMQPAMEGISFLIQSLLKPTGNISTGLKDKEYVYTSW